MGKVVNLNRFRKKKAKAEKEQRAERNRRFHGRTAAERFAEDFEKRKLEKKLDGALLVPERVDTERLMGPPEQVYEALEQATRQVVSLSEFSERLNAERSFTPKKED